MEAHLSGSRIMEIEQEKAFAQKFGTFTSYEHHTTSVVFSDPLDHTRIRKTVSICIH